VTSFRNSFFLLTSFFLENKKKIRMARYENKNEKKSSGYYSVFEKFNHEVKLSIEERRSYSRLYLAIYYRYWKHEDEAKQSSKHHA
jgi:hypothetical protein